MKEPVPQSRVPQSDAKVSSKIQETAPPSTNPVDPKPLAAYILGYNSSMVRMRQYFFWNWPPEELDDEVNVQTELIELQAAVIKLTGEITKDVSCELANMCVDIARITARGISTDESTHNAAFWFESEEATGYREWNELRTLVRDALPENSLYKSWCRLGAEIANFRMELIILECTQLPVQHDDGDTTDCPSLQLVLDWASELYRRGSKTLPEIELLHSCRKIIRFDPQVKIFCQVVGPQNYDLDKQGPTETHDVLTYQMKALDRRIRRALCKIKPGMVGEQDEEIW